MPIDPQHDPMRLTELLVQWMKANPAPDDITDGPRTMLDESEVVAVGEVPERDDMGIRTVSAWAGTGALADPKGYAEFAKRIGLTRIDLMVNEHSAWREPKPFSTHSLSKIDAFAREVHRVGLELHLTSWLMPHAAYIDSACRILLATARQVDARSVLFDCEEPWTQARAPLPYASAAAMVRQGFEDFPIGVTGIGYAPTAKLSAICAAADYLVPQCYSTESSKQSPAIVVPRFAARWRRVFPGKPIVVGLAAYRQMGIPGFSAESALRTAFGGAQADPHADTVIYWSLAEIRRKRPIAEIIAELAHTAAAA